MPRAKIVTEIRSLARSHTRTALNVLVGVMRSKDATAAAKVSAANAILDRGWGKAVQAIENGGEGPLELIHKIERMKIPTAKIFEPLLAPARYKAVHGGRGSGKSHFFGELLVEICQAERGTSAVCIREAQKTLAQSSKRLIESKIAGLGLRHQFKIFSDKIATPRRWRHHLPRHAGSHGRFDKIPRRLSHCVGRRSAIAERAQPFTATADHPRGEFGIVGVVESAPQERCGRRLLPGQKSRGRRRR
jgi:hypothetical protein